MRINKFLFYTLLVLFLISTSFSTIIAVSPAMAVKYVPDIPIVKELIKFSQENDELKDKLEVNADAIEEYKDTLTEDERNEIANLVLNFIRAQYSGDLDTLYSYCSEQFIEVLKDDPFLVQARDNEPALKFVLISNIAKEDGNYMAFIRLEDEGMDSQYQLNFYLIKDKDSFLIDNIEKDI
ncbi:hypothetical protein OXPF_39970 [Oxobacter pfennigii]|uniref:DUF3887 domain-containing protein n=1 Tax=Oxobacter pfennigii TaxID=36849 RepID=A0A0P8YRK0_9CLOT|nr:hypothetical protein [Oxobacter pfennigii]KPU42213.1 hypothetical protein OXPF_39970 [Oxobacter pfennigii]